MQAVAVKILNCFCQSVQFRHLREKKIADITCIHTKCNNHHLMHTQSVSNISNLKKNFCGRNCRENENTHFSNFFKILNYA